MLKKKSIGFCNDCPEIFNRVFPKGYFYFSIRGFLFL